MSTPQRRVTSKWLGDLESVQAASEKIPGLFNDVATQLQIVDKEHVFGESFSSLSEPGMAADWVERLLLHHCRVQRVSPLLERRPGLIVLMMVAG